MNISAMLCDHAQVAGGKLFVSGAGINVVGTPVPAPPHPMSVALALLVTIPWNATNQPHALTIELVSDTGEGGSERIPLGDQLPPGHDQADMGMIVAQFNAGRGPQMRPGEDTLMPVAIPLSLGLPRPGDYFFDLSIDGTQMARVSFRMVVSTPGFGQLGGGRTSPTGW